MMVFTHYTITPDLLALNSWAFKHSLFILIGGFNNLLSIKFESLKLWKVHRPYPYTIQRSATLNTREIFPSTISAGHLSAVALLASGHLLFKGNSLSVL